MKRIKKATKWSLVIQNAAKRKLNYTTSAAALANYNNNINNNNNNNNMINNSNYNNYNNKSRINLLTTRHFSKNNKNKKKTDIPETVDILHQQFSDQQNHKALEGHVVDVKDSFVKVTGIQNASIGSSITFENGMKGLVVSLETNTIGVTLLRHEKKTQNNSISPNYYNDNNMISMNVHDKIDSSTINRNKENMIEPITFPVGTNLIGQTVDPLGYPIYVPNVYDENIQGGGNELNINENEVFVGDDGVKPIIQKRVVPSSKLTNQPAPCL